MAKRGYKLQEFVAQPSNVNCLRIGKKACQLLLTGGDDHKANLWVIGKPTSLMSLCGHTIPVESLAFDSTKVLVLAGASSGTVKLWDLEEGKNGGQLYMWGKVKNTGDVSKAFHGFDVIRRYCTAMGQGRVLKHRNCFLLQLTIKFHQISNLCSIEVEIVVVLKYCTSSLILKAMVPMIKD